MVKEGAIPMEYLCDSNAYGKNTDRMKYRLADAMKQCMKTAPVEKITVKEIVEACGNKADLLSKFQGQIRSDQLVF